MKLEIYNEEDRLTVASILVKNGYIVWQSKEKKTPSSTTYIRVLNAEKQSEVTKR